MVLQQAGSWLQVWSRHGLWNVNRESSSGAISGQGWRHLLDLAPLLQAPQHFELLSLTLELGILLSHCRLPQGVVMSLCPCLGLGSLVPLPPCLSVVLQLVLALPLLGAAESLRELSFGCSGSKGLLLFPSGFSQPC